MALLAILLASAACLTLAYRVYGSLLARLLRLDDSRMTPAVEQRDDRDYQPTPPAFLLGQHFSAIAAAGPIVGPIVAGVMFGWLPALLWILVGSIFIGGVHDFTALVASIRHKARSIAQVVHDHMSRRSYVLFLLFVWIALVYIIVAFTDIVAGSFNKAYTCIAPGGTAITVPAGSIASSSLLYLALPLLMGALLRLTRLPLAWATVIFLPLAGMAIWAGPHIPFDLAAALNLSPQAAHRTWDVLLLLYCFAASMTPVWLLLQPRGHLGGYFLFAALGAGAIGVIIGSVTGSLNVNYPAFTGWLHTAPSGEQFPLAPMLFIFIACGACSGFHCLIASGTTSKQLRRQSDAKLIGYGAMLMEAMVSILALSCVIILLPADAAKQSANPDFLYAQGLGTFLSTLGVPFMFGLLFGLLAFTTFVYDTLDVCTRLGRFIVQELTGLHNAAGRWIGTALTTLVPLVFVMQHTVDARGNPVPAWKVFWPLFGASNQLLAALALIGITVWLWRTYRARWVWLVMAGPTVFMYTMSAWALLRYIRAGFFDPAGSQFTLPAAPVPWVALVLIVLAAVLLFEAVRVFITRPPAPPHHAPSLPVPVSVPAPGSAIMHGR